MPDEVMLNVPVPLRGDYATQLIAAARKLDIHVREVKSQTDGFLIPEELHRYLFPSQYDGGEEKAPQELPLNELVALDPDAEVIDTTEPEQEVSDAEIRAWAADNDIPVSERGKLAQKVRDAYLEANGG